jgi:hypothetical protein
VIRTHGPLALCGALAVRPAPRTAPRANLAPPIDHEEPAFVSARLVAMRLLVHHHEHAPASAPYVRRLMVVVALPPGATSSPETRLHRGVDSSLRNSLADARS